MNENILVGRCAFAGGGGGSNLEYYGSGVEIPKFVHGLVDPGKTAKSFIDYNSESASQIVIEITLKNGSKTKAIIDL